MFRAVPYLKCATCSGGSILIIFMYYQFLNFKYTTSVYSRQMMGNIGTSLDGYAYRFLPSTALAIYQRIKVFLYTTATRGMAPAAAATPTE